MAHAVDTQQVRMPLPLQNVDSSGNVEQRGGLVLGSVDVTSYAAPEVINAAELGLNVIYGITFLQGESAEYEAHNAVVAAGGKSVSVTFDNVGTGTEATATDNVAVVHFIAWGEQLGSGSN